MGDLPTPLAYLLLTWGVITGILVILVIYRATLSTREDDQIYISKAGDSMMAAEQRMIIGKMNRLGRPILGLTLLSGTLLLASAGVWVWIGLKTF
jgi:hypothetical protein